MPEAVDTLDHILATATVAHEQIFDLHRDLTGLDAADDESRARLAEAVRISLTDIPTVLRPALELMERWLDQSVLDRDAAEGTVVEIEAELKRVASDLERLQARLRGIARELQASRDEARRA